MGEIRQKGSIWRAPEKRLYTKKGVYTNAWIYGVEHKNSNEIEVSLKIGRYTYPRELETETPKSELTLTKEELDPLLSYVAEYYKPIETKTENFIPIENKDMASVLSKLKDMAISHEDFAKALFDSEYFTENVHVAITAMKRNKALIEYQNKIGNRQNESFWQNWFNDNKWILGSEYSHIIDERDIDTNHIADFLLKAFDGFVDIVEIKKPDTQFWSTTRYRNKFVPSVELTQSITQCQNYIFEIEREMNNIKTYERLKAKIVKPRCLLIIGRSKEWDDEKTKAYRILNSSYVNLTILTFDHLLERYKSFMQEVRTVNELPPDDDLPF